MIREDNKDMIIDESEVIYTENDFVIVHDPTAADLFTLSLCTGPVRKHVQEFNVIMLTRRSQSRSEFEPIHEQKIKMTDVLGTPDNIHVVKGEGASQGKDGSLRIFLSNKDYKKISKKVQEILKKRGKIDLTDREDVIEEEIVEKELISQMMELEIVTSKKKKVKPARAKKRSVSRGGKRVAKRKKLKLPKYKKGKYNPRIGQITYHHQFDNPSSEPVWGKDLINNSKELIRAANNNNIELLEKCLDQAERYISSLNVTTGPKSEINPFIMALMNKNYELFFKLYDFNRDPNSRLRRQEAKGISFVDTGYNDKYAYGVATKTVALSRGGRQGFNAFFENEGNMIGTARLDELTMLYIIKNISDISFFEKLISINQDMRTQFMYKLPMMVQYGNYTIAGFFTDLGFKSEGHGFNKFHVLASTAQSPDELNEMKKVNTKKKPFGLQAITPTHIACVNPNGQILKKFLEIGGEAYVMDDMGRKPIHYAACCLSTEPLQVLLDQGIDCRDVDRYKATPLMYAAKSGMVHNITLMCNHLAYNVSLKDRNGMGAIHYAAENNNLECVKELKKFGADLNQAGRYRTYPIMMAAIRGNLEMVKFLAENGASLIRTDKNKVSVLSHAVMNNNLKVASYLLSKGAPIDLPDSSKNFPLHYAAGYGHLEMIELCLQAGADINCVNNWNMTPILIALLMNRYESMHLLTEFCGIDVDCQDNNGMTLLGNAISKFTEESFKFFKYLLEKKRANPNIVNVHGNNCLNILINRSSQINLHNALTLEERKEAKAAHSDLFKRFYDLLLEYGVDVNKANLNKQTPIILALLKNNKQAIEMLLCNNSIDLINLPNKETTIFHYCEKLFYLKNGIQIFNRIVEIVGNLSDYSHITDREGFNHFLSLSESYFTTSNAVDSIYNVKQTQYNNMLERLRKEAENNQDNNMYSAEKERIIAKINGVADRIVKRRELKEQCYSQIVSIFENHNYDFSTRVKLIKTSYEDSKYENQNIARSHYYFVNTYNSGNISNTIIQRRNREGAQKKTYDFLINADAECSILHIICKNPNLAHLDQICEILRNQNNFANNCINYFGETVWHYLARYGVTDEEIVDSLCSKGEDVDLADFKGNYPLLDFVKKGNLTMFDKLISLDAKMDITDKNGLSPFIYFAKHRNIEKVKQMIDLGCDVNITDAKQRNALHWAINNNTSSDTNFLLEEILIDAGVNKNRSDKRNRTPLHYFFVKIGEPAINDKYDPIELFSDYLIFENINLDQRDNFGNTPLFYAAQRGAYLCCSTLIQRGCDRNNVNNSFNTIFNSALLNDHTDIAILLLQRNIKIVNTVYRIDLASMIRWKQLNKEESMKVEKGGIEKRKGMAVESNNEQSGYQPRRLKTKQVGTPFKSSRNRNRGQINKENEEEEKIKLKELADKNFVTKKLTPFKLALETNNDSIKYLLISNGFDVGLAVTDCFEQKAIQYSIKLLSKKFDQNEAKNNKRFQTTNEEGQNCFHILSKNCNGIDRESFKRILKLLIAKKIDINAEDDSGTPPLIYTALNCNSNREFIDDMIEVGANPNSTDSLGNSVLSAIIQNNSEIKQAVFKDDIGVDLKLKSKSGKNVILKKRPFAEPIPALIAPRKAKARVKRRALPSRMITGSMKKSARKVKYNQWGEEVEKDDVNENNLSINIYDWIESYIQRHKPDINQIFEKRGDSVNQDDSFIGSHKKNRTYTPLSYAVLKLKNFRIIKLFIESGADINNRDHKGHTILTHAIKKNLIPLITFLKQYEEQIDFEIVDRKGSTYIHHVISPFKAASYRNTKLLRYLGNKIDVNKPDKNGEPPLFYAMQQGSEANVQILLDLGATPLPYPKERTQMEIIASQIYPQIKYDYEADYKEFIENIKKNHSENVEVENKDKLDDRVTGQVKLVYDENRKPYDIALIKVEVHYGHFSSNVFYKMQIAYEELRKIYILFTNWGRMGQQGQHQLTPFFALNDCLTEFKKIFKQKTGNDYDNLDNFNYVTRKYNLIKKIKYVKHTNVIEKLEIKEHDQAGSQLPNDLRMLMKQLLDAKFYKTIFWNFYIREEVMPLGNIPEEIIEKANEMLMEIKKISKELEEKRKELSSSDMLIRANQIAELTSRYYELIPTERFQTTNIPVFNTYKVTSELNRLNDLMNLEKAVRLMCAAQYRKAEIHPFDYCIKNLAIKIKKLNPLTEEFAIIKRYIKSGASSLPKNQLGNIFAIERKEEVERFEKWENNTNRRLLFHGTRTENVLSIIQQGLRIKPSESNYHGQSMGDGVYLTDHFGQALDFSSYNFGWSDKPAYVLICEVALGRLKKVYQRTVHVPPLKEHDSIKLSGRNTHDPNQRIYLNDGCMVPAGKLYSKTKPKSEEITYFASEANEFCVFDISQVKIRYLVELKKNQELNQS